MNEPKAWIPVRLGATVPSDLRVGRGKRSKRAAFAAYAKQMRHWMKAYNDWRRARRAGSKEPWRDPRLPAK